MRPLLALAAILFCVTLQSAHAQLRQVATSGQFTASVDRATHHPALQEQILFIAAPKMDAFTPTATGDLAKLLTASATYIASQAMRYPIESFTLNGLTDGAQVFWGTATYDKVKKIWTLNAKFDAAAEIEKLAFLPESMSGILTLAHHQKKQQETTKGVSAVYNAALKRRAEEITGKALADFGVQAGKIEAGYTGLPKIQEMADRFLKAAEQVGAPARQDIIAARDSAIAVNIQPEIERTLAHVGTNIPAHWDDVFTLEDVYAPTYSKLTGLKQKDARARIEAAYALKANAWLAETKYIQQFDEDLAQIPADFEAMEELAELAALLDSQVERIPALVSYVEKVQLRMGEVIISRCEALLRVIAEAGTGIDDIPGLLEESETEAEWFEEQEFDDIAAIIRLAALARCYELSETGYDVYAAKIKAYTGDEKSIAGLREDIVFLETYKEDIADLERYEKLAKDRIETLLYEADAQLYQAIGITRDTRNTSINVSGHVMSLAAFAKNIGTKGHKVTGAKIGESFTSETSSALGFLGWAKPAKTLESISITTQEGIQVELAMTGMQGADTFTPDTIRQGDDEEDLVPSEWVALALTLGGVVPNGLPGADGVTDSDRFGSDPDDPKKVVEYGIFADELDTELVIAASAAAIESNPEQPRYFFHLGRALAIAGDQESAKPFLMAADEAGYGAASFYLGAMLFESAMQPNAPLSVGTLREAAKYYARAAAQGHPLAKDAGKSATDMLALFAPPFSSLDLYSASAMQAFYDNDFSYFKALEKTKHVAVRDYCLGLRAIASSENNNFSQSAINTEIHTYVKQFEETMQRMNSLAALAGPLNMSGGRDDGEKLMMYLNVDDAEVMRFFQNVLTYLKQYH